MTLFGHVRELPAAEEQRRDDRADDEQVAPLRHEEEQVAHPAVLGRETRDQLRLGFGQIERRAVTLGQRRYIEDVGGDEGERIGEQEPMLRRPALRADDPLHRERAGHQHDRENRQPRRYFVTDYLRRRADSADQRPLVIRRPSRHQHADHGERGDRRHIEDADVQVGENQMTTRTASPPTAA